MSVGTAFHPRTSALNSTMAWGEWSGYFAAAVYADSHDIEYNAIREQAALIDVTPSTSTRSPGPTRRIWSTASSRATSRGSPSTA